MFNRKEYMKKYQQEHKEVFRIATQKYRDKDRKKYNEHSNEYRKRKYKEAKENAELVIKQKEVLKKIKEILKDYGNKEDISEITMYYISGESLIHILELLEEIE